MSYHTPQSHQEEVPCYKGSLPPGRFLRGAGVHVEGEGPPQPGTLWDLVVPVDLLELREELAKVDQWLDDERFFKPCLKRFNQRLGRPAGRRCPDDYPRGWPLEGIRCEPLRPFPRPDPFRQGPDSCDWQGLQRRTGDSQAEVQKATKALLGTGRRVVAGAKASVGAPGTAPKRSVRLACSYCHPLPFNKGSPLLNAEGLAS